MIRNLLLGAIALSFNVLIFSQSQTQINWKSDDFSQRSFIENKGQFLGRDWKKFGTIDYAYTQNPFYIFLSNKGLTYRMDKIIKNEKHKKNHLEPKRINVSELVFVEWMNANENIEVISTEKVSNYYSYGIKREDGTIKNLNHVPGFKKITYKNVYDRIDFEYLIHPDGGIKYNIVLHPGANPNDIQLRYSSSHTNVSSEHIEFELNDLNQLSIETSLGQIIEHQPTTFYVGSETKIDSKYIFQNDILTFDLSNYDNNQTVVIDPWIVSPTFNSSTAVWEVETDGVGNVYAIGGETPMELWKYNSAGTLQWQYVTPWDTNNVWLGTLATDANGNSYVTSGVTAEMHKVDNAGNFIWQSSLSGGLQYNSEWWSITFNCDETKLITGGTWVDGILSFDFYAGIFEIDVVTGNVISDQTVDQTNIGGFGASPVEVRSISSSKNSRFIFLTHNDVGSINENFGACPNSEPVFQLDNGHNYGYKCENYLPATQNGGGLKALVANDNYLYTHSGNQIHRRDLNTGALINSAPIPGGVSTTVPIIGGLVVENSGLAVDDCGNVYAGSTNQVLKFDADLNLLSSSPTTFAVYDVSVNSNGEVIACGAQQDNQSTNRNGKIESISMTACSQYALVCCDANFCNPGTLCITSSPVSLSPFTAGGTWSGNGVNASGVFDPASAGVGSHEITYSLLCGTNTITIQVNPCDIQVCEESNGDITASSSSATNYTWYEQVTSNDQIQITSEQQCIDCPTANPIYFFGNYISCDQLLCTLTNTYWQQYATGTTATPPASFPILVVSDLGDSLVILNAGQLSPCSVSCSFSVTATLDQNPSTCGATDGSISICGLTASTTYDDLSYNNGTSIVSIGSFTSDASGCYLINNLGSGAYVDFSVTLGGCSEEDAGPISLSDPGGPTIVGISENDPTCVGDCDGFLSANVTGGSAPYTYQWYDSGGNPIGPNDATITDLCADDYSLVVTDAGGGGGTVQLFYDDFESGATGWNLNVTTGPEGADPNYFEVDDDEGGVAPPGCGIAGNGNATLHITSVFFPGGGAAYDAGGLCGLLFCPETHRQAETPLINTIGQTNLTLNFDFIANGAPPQDQATVWYNNGSGWTQLGGTLSSGTVGCAPQGTWTAYSQSLPASCENIANLQLAIRWQNNDDGVGSDPSVAINNFEVTATSSGGSCSTSQTASLIDPIGINPIASLLSEPTTCGAADGIIEICGLQASTTYDNLSYDSGAGTIAYGSFSTDGTGCFQISGLVADSYSNFVVINSGCSGTDINTITLTNPPGPTPIVTLGSGTSVCGASDGVINICGLVPSTIYDNFDYINDIGPQTGGTFTTDASGCYAFTGLSASTYSMFIITISGCSGMDPGPITISDPGSPTPTVTINSQPSDCGASDGIIDICGLIASTNYDDLSYTTSTGIVNLGSFNSDGTGCFQLTGLSADTYFNFSITDAGCTGSDPGPLTLTEPSIPTPSASLVQNPTGCGISDGIIEICGLEASTSYDNLSYNSSSGVVAIGSFLTDATGCYQLTGLAADSYSDFVVNIGSCIGSDASNIALSSSGGPSITINIVSSITCNGDSDGSLQAVAVGGTSPYSYSWSPVGGSLDLASNLASGNYSVNVTDDAGCVGVATLFLDEPEPISITGTVTDANCGQSDGSIMLNVTGGTPNYVYSWSPGGEITSSLLNINGGSYVVDVTDNNGCVSSAFFTVLSVGTIPVNASPSVETILSGESVQLSVTGASDYLWAPSSGLSCTNCSDPIASPTTTTTYFVTGTDSLGCTGSDTVLIVVTIACADMYIPNILAPNSTELYNRTVCVFGDCIAELSFRIYNRWGQKVFETETSMNPANESLMNEICWDGTQNGKELQTGVYVYSLYAKMNNGEIVERSGNITIVR